MKSLDDVKPRSSDVKWRDQVAWKSTKQGKWQTYRLIGGVVSIAQHWVKFQSQKTQKQVTFPVDCLAWNGDEEAADPNLMHKCPGCQANIKTSVKYLFNVIDREVQESGASQFIRGFDMPPTAMKKIVELKNLNVVDKVAYSIAHPIHGCDIHVQLTQDAKGYGDWSIQKGDRTPLTPAEQGAELYDFEDIYVPTDEANARTSLIRAGLLQVSESPPPGAQMPPAGAMQAQMGQQLPPTLPLQQNAAPAQTPPTVAAATCHSSSSTCHTTSATERGACHATPRATRSYPGSYSAGRSRGTTASCWSAGTT